MRRDPSTLGSLRIIPAFLALALAACATGPKMDGGIVGTGNRPDCEARKTEGAGAAPAEECKREAGEVKAK